MNEVPLEESALCALAEKQTMAMIASLTGTGVEIIAPILFASCCCLLDEIARVSGNSRYETFGQFAAAYLTEENQP